MNKIGWMLVFRYLNVKDLFYVQSVCQGWYDILNKDNLVWKIKARELGLNYEENAYEMFKQLSEKIEIVEVDKRYDFVYNLNYMITIGFYRYKNLAHDILIKFKYNNQDLYIYLRYSVLNTEDENALVILIIEPTLISRIKYLINPNRLWRQIFVDGMENWEKIGGNVYVYKNNVESGIVRCNNQPESFLNYSDFKLSADNNFNQIINIYEKYFYYYFLKDRKNPCSLFDMIHI